MGVVTTDEFSSWYADPEKGLKAADIEAVTEAIDLLEAVGVALGHPQSSQLKGARNAIRELRIQSHGKPIRIAYAFDPARHAVVLIGGYKGGDKQFYG